MADTAPDDMPTHPFHFIRSVDGGGGECKWPSDLEKARQALGEALDARNVAFLLGAGCPSSVIDNREVGAPAMVPLARESTMSREAGDPSFPTANERDHLFRKLGVDIDANEYTCNWKG